MRHMYEFDDEPTAEASFYERHKQHQNQQSKTNKNFEALIQTP